MFFRSPGYAISLLAESSTSAIHCAEAVSHAGVAAEEIGLRASRALLTEISKGGCVDRRHQILVLLMMALGSEDVGRCRMGEPTSRTYVVIFCISKPVLSSPFRIQFLRDLRSFLGTSFKIVPVGTESQLLYSCCGTGYVNVNRTLA